MSATISSLTGLKNFSFLAVPAVWVISVSAHFYGIHLTKGAFSNASPRQYVALISQKQNKSSIDQRFIRAESAQLNGFENIGLFAAAIVAGNVAKLPASQLNQLALAYVVSRIVYNFVYITSTSEKLVPIRTATFLAGVGIIFKLFVSSAYALSENQSWL